MTQPPHLATAHLRALLSGAASEAIHDVGAPDHLAEIMEMIEREPALRTVDLGPLSATEADVWRRICEAP